MFVFIWSETCRRLAEDRQWPTHNYLTNQTTNSCEQNASWRANSFPSSQETVCPIFYKTRRFITVFTRASHMSLYLTSSIIRRSPNRFLQDFFFLYSRIDALVFQMVSFRFRHQNPARTSPPPYALHAPSIPFLIWTPGRCLVRWTDHEAPHYVVASSLLLSRLSQG